MQSHRTEIEYRIRWKRSGRRHRTRYYMRKHFAEKACFRYQEADYQVELASREVLILADWSVTESYQW